jgi:small subunit ribosomal protein S8
MKHDPVADMFCVIKNSERTGRKECLVHVSSMIGEILRVMEAHKYIGKFELVPGERGKRYRIGLLGRINDCNVVRPRFSVKKNEFIKWEKRFLPASDTGLLIVTTPTGVMDHKKAKEKETGGKLLGFVY